MPLGVSVVIPCYNGAERLPETLAHIAVQRVPPGLQWEVVLVDNGSTDGTAEVARRAWPASAPTPLRIAHEPRLGLSHAHVRSFAEARHELVTFVEDDNWIAPDFLAVALEVMQAHPEVGACGGRNEAAWETLAPVWFERFAEHYAVGTQGPAAGDITDTRGHLWGAGLTVRASAWRQLVEGGFRPLLADRVGHQLNSGGDTEISFALRLAGWRLWYDPRLRLRHFTRTGRLQWSYLRRLHRGFGTSWTGLEAYRLALADAPPSWAESMGMAWALEAAKASLRLARHPARLLGMGLGSSEGDATHLDMERVMGRLGELLRLRSDYDSRIDALRRAAFRRRLDRARPAEG
jgi:glycosyltransferase involved in cell wall biosynthesis